MSDAQRTEAKSHFEPISVKETLTSVMIAFIMAFVFRGFVIEGFLIPTGSMAPTLLGKHMRFLGPDTGYDFEVGPWDYADPRTGQIPLSIQGANASAPIRPMDPMTHKEWDATKVPLRAGDRVFVLKYLPVLFEPSRWDVVVFKNPGTEENYIKRLVGLPSEQLAIVDGDIFTRPTSVITGDPRGAQAWAEDNWSIQRKPERVQRAMFQLLFDSIYTPPSAGAVGSNYRAPWRGEGDWSGVNNSVSYRKNGSGAASLDWRTEDHPITDWAAYNVSRLGRNAEFPAPDVAMSFGIQPDPGAAPITITAVLDATGFEFRAEYDAGAGRVTMKMRPQDAPDSDPWRTIVDDAQVPKLVADGAATTVEFWHADQALYFFIDGKLVAGGRERGAYELTPAERMQAATGHDLGDLLRRFPDPNDSILGEPSTYQPTTLHWEFTGGPFTLHRVALKRDIYYQHHPSEPTRGANPMLPVVLNNTQYFMCGDNSPSSLDSRLWQPGAGRGAPDPWIADQVDDTLGVVHKDLLIGKAFVVYFPAPLRETKVPIPDVGRMRWIW
ncbi:MAG: S26 family signal peptidase [Phycisphaerales bacterium]